MPARPAHGPSSRFGKAAAILIVLLGLLQAYVTTAIAPAAAAQASSQIDGPITRGEVIWRAQYWVDHQPGPYDQGGYSPGPGGDFNYRRDCSGYVSMAWHLGYNYWTGSLEDADFTYEIPRSELKAGDILNSYHDHVFLFHEWIDDRGGFSYYSFGSTPVSHRTANINNAYLDGHPNGDYKALRYTRIVDGAPDDPPAVRHPSGAGRLVSSWSADGRLETFAAAADGVWHAYQTAANGPWSQWRALGGPRNAQLAIAANKDGRLELFALSADTFQHMFQTAPNGSWSSWRSFGTGANHVAAGHNADGRIEVFATDTNGVFHRWQTTPNGSWSDWAGTGGPGNGARLELELARDGRLELFALNNSTFGHLHQTTANGSWSDWRTFGTGGHDLTVDHNTDGRIEVFASNPTGIFHKWQTSTSTWSDWTATGGPTNAELATERSTDGRVELFATNTNSTQHAWQTSPNSPYTDWQSFGPGGTELATSHNHDGRIEVFTTRTTGTHHRWQTTTDTWSDWAHLNNPGPVIS